MLRCAFSICLIEILFSERGVGILNDDSLMRICYILDLRKANATFEMLKPLGPI